MQHNLLNACISWKISLGRKNYSLTQNTITKDKNSEKYEKRDSSNVQIFVMMVKIFTGEKNLVISSLYRKISPKSNITTLDRNEHKSPRTSLHYLIVLIFALILWP